MNENKRLIDYIYSEPYPFVGPEAAIIDWSEGVMKKALQYFIDENRKLLDDMEKLQPKCWFEGSQPKCKFVKENDDEKD